MPRQFNSSPFRGSLVRKVFALRKVSFRIACHTLLGTLSSGELKGSYARLRPKLRFLG